MKIINIRKEGINALNYLSKGDNISCSEFQKKFPNTASTIIGMLKAKNAILILTDGTIWHVDKEEINSLVSYFEKEYSTGNILSKYWKIIVDVFGIIGVVIAIIGIIQCT